MTTATPAPGDYDDYAGQYAAYVAWREQDGPDADPLWESGIRAYYHHRTLENYLDAFHSGGLRLTKLADVPALADVHKPDAWLPPGGRFPRFMLLAFTKP